MMGSQGVVPGGAERVSLQMESRHDGVAAILVRHGARVRIHAHAPARPAAHRTTDRGHDTDRNAAAFLTKLSRCVRVASEVVAGGSPCARDDTVTPTGDDTLGWARQSYSVGIA